MLTLDADILVKKNAIPEPVNNSFHMGLKTAELNLAMARMVLVFFLSFHF